jgi:1,4-dihydroxy-2-naphthoate octaprenyltransferase
MNARSPNPWVLAARPRTLWAAVSPVLVGSGLAVGSGVFRADAMAAALVCALSLQVAANFANDASDARRGADPENRIGPTRAVATGLLASRQAWMAVWAMFATAGACGLYVASITSWLVVGVGAVAILATLTYTGGPSPYGYRGLGEVSVFIFFGLAATVGTRYAHDGTAPLEAWILAVPVGLTASAILVANNVRDIDTDAAAGKRTLAVALGRDRARVLYTATVAAAFAAIALAAGTGLVPRWAALGLLTAPLALPLIRTIHSTAEGPALIRVLEGTARLHLLVGIGLGIGAAFG